MKVVFGIVPDKGRYLVEEGNVRFITGIGGTVAKDGCYVGFAIKWSTYILF